MDVDDASGSYGRGDYVLQEGQFLKSLPVEQAFSEQFITRMSHKHINAKEMTAFFTCFTILATTLQRVPFNYPLR